MDIVLRAGSEWAMEWKCGKGGDEGMQVRNLKRELGLLGPPGAEWRGVVVVGSVEDGAV